MSYDDSKLPLNTKNVYTVGKCQSGCDIFIPVDSNDDLVGLEKKAELQAFLDSQPSPMPDQPLPERPDPEPLLA